MLADLKQKAKVTKGGADDPLTDMIKKILKSSHRFFPKPEKIVDTRNLEKVVLNVGMIGSSMKRLGWQNAEDTEYLTSWMNTILEAA